jgi:diacylglycerol kinase family enzyme
VNNVSLGVYPYIVQDPSYRDGRLKTTTDLLPELLDPERTPVDLRFTSPSGVRYETAQVVLVSNNPYRSGVSVDGAGRRVSLDGGVLGVLVVAASDPAGLAAAVRDLALGAGIDAIDGLDQWSAPTLRVESDGPVILAGVDGEAMELPAPLDIRVVPRGLRVIVPVGTPEPPAPTEPLLSTQALGDLLALAGGVDTGPFGDDQ